MISSHISPVGAPTDDAFTIGFWVCAAVGVVALLGAILAPSMTKRREQALALGIDDFPEDAAEVHAVTVR